MQTPEQPLRSESTLTPGLTSGERLPDPLFICDKQNLALSGTLYVADKEDDDWVGLVFSYQVLFIGPESDHWECLSLAHSLTDSLTHCCLVNLIDVTLACEDTNSKLVDIVTVANVDDEDCIGNSLLQIWELRIVHKAKLLFRL